MIWRQIYAGSLITFVALVLCTPDGYTGAEAANLDTVDLLMLWW